MHWSNWYKTMSEISMRPHVQIIGVRTFRHVIRHFRMLSLSVRIFAQLTKSCCHLHSKTYLFIWHSGLLEMCNTSVWIVWNVYSETAQKKNIVLMKRADTPIVFKTSILKVNAEPNQYTQSPANFTSLWICIFYGCSTSLNVLKWFCMWIGLISICIVHKFGNFFFFSKINVIPSVV